MPAIRLSVRILLTSVCLGVAGDLHAEDRVMLGTPGQAGIQDASSGSSTEAVTLEQLSVEGTSVGVVGPQGGITVGYLTKQTRSATKTNTPLIDTPQSVTIVTQEQIRDQNFQNLTDQLRYVPGIVPAQGESNRDQAIIRGQNTSADFFVNGIRDDVQYFRDLYNIQRIEVLKGPDSLIFGRGGGGVIN